MMTTISLHLAFFVWLISGGAFGQSPCADGPWKATVEEQQGVLLVMGAECADR